MKTEKPTTANQNEVKLKLENDPDSTGGDTKADKTKKETFPDKQKNK